MLATKLQVARLALCLFALNQAVAQAQISKFRSARFHGEDYVALADLARHFALGPDRGGAPTVARYDRLEVEAERANIVLDGVQHWLNRPIVADHGRFWISNIDVLKVVDPILRPQQFKNASRPTRILLDPGHGGGDRGAIGRAGRPEKELTLDLARRVERQLADRGVEILLSRRADDTLSLDDRVAAARRQRAALFISLHFNAARSSAQGVETFVLPPHGYASTASDTPPAADAPREAGNQHDLANLWLGHCVQKELLRRSGAPDRGVRRARFKVLREAPCPAVLVEAGFLSNHDEEGKILTAAYRDTLAAAIADGIRAYLESTEG